MIDYILTTFNTDADDGGSGNATEVDIPNLASVDNIELRDRGIYYIFQGTRTGPVEIVSASDQTQGVTVPPHSPWIVGPFIGRHGRYQHLHAPSLVSVDLTIALGRAGSEFLSKRLTEESGYAVAEDTGTDTTSSFADIITLESQSDELFTEVKPWHNNNGGASSRFRVLSANKPSVDVTSPPTADDISGNENWEEVYRESVADGSYGPGISSDGFDVYTHGLVLQQDDDGTSTAVSCDNALFADTEK